MHPNQYTIKRRSTYMFPLSFSVTANQYLIPNQCYNEALSFFHFLTAHLSLYLPLSVCFIPPLRRIASHVSLVTIVMLQGFWSLQGNAGKVSSVWGVQIALTLL